MYRISAPGSKPGLERIKELLNALDNPQQNLPAVHIAGTNGKGSTSLIIADIITRAGYRVGRFISPHLHSYRERFTVDGKEIAAENLKRYLDQVEAVIPAIMAKGCEQPTEFEILTAIAFLYFRDENVDLAVLEAGMGGLYDSTNVINPILAVITSIEYDHIAFLGNTIEEIAFNKAGIIKPGIKVVMGAMHMDAQRVISMEAEQQQAEIIAADSIQVERVQPPGLHGQYINLQSRYFKLNNAHFSLLGDYQLGNLATAISSVDILKEHNFKVEAKHILKALTRLKMPGRMEVLQWQPLVIGDVAHNPQGARAVANSLQHLMPGRSRVLLCGFLDDKDIKANLEALGNHTRTAVISRPLGDRANNWRAIARFWKELYPHKDCCEVENITAAVNQGLDLLSVDEYLLITGSFYLLDEARKYFYKINSNLT